MLKVFVQKRSIELIISEKLYGEFELEKVLEDLILSKPVQRSKGIHQGGASYLVNENDSKWPTAYCQVG